MDERQAIFERLRELMRRYSPPFTPHHNSETYYDLWSEKDLIIDGRKRKEVYFTGLVIQKSYVGFYYMPVYSDQAAKTFIAPNLLARLKGKSCFHINRLDDELLAQIEDALARGFELYRQRGWV